MTKDYGFATRQIHGGHAKNAAGALTSPIYQSSTFVFDDAKQGAQRFAGKEDGYIYTRLGNPTELEVENKLASLEGGLKLAYSLPQEWVPLVQLCIPS